MTAPVTCSASAADATYGLGGWWSLEIAGTRGTFCIENCIEKLTFWPAPGTEKAGDAANLAAPGGASGGPEVFNTGITDFGQTFRAGFTPS